MILEFIGEKLHTSLERYREKGLIINPTTKDFCLWVDGCKLTTVLSNLQTFINEYVATVVAYAIAEKLEEKEPPALRCDGAEVWVSSEDTQPKVYEYRLEEIIELLS